MKPSAKIICDSISEQGHRLTTLEVVMHRFILAEMNTHRVFSRNSASSRAIPYKKIRQRVVDDLAYPVHWGSEQQGMQSGAEIDYHELPFVMDRWNEARGSAIEIADALHSVELHKSLINRLLEPFMWHTAIISATEWDNFFWQRCDPAAQPEMKAVADEMQRAYYTSKPVELAHGEWHLPYINQTDWAELEILRDKSTNKLSQKQIYDLLKKISTARCARVSYLTHDGIRSLDKDLELYEKLLRSGHWSPFEHVATPVNVATYQYRGLTGNFVGWKQYRKEFSGENRLDFVPNLPDLMK